MALNKQIYTINPTKSRIIGLSDTIRSDIYAYTTIYTVLSTETLVIREGSFTITGSNTSGVLNEGMIILNISGKDIVLYNKVDIAGADLINESFTLTDKGLSGIVLTTGDTIKIKYVYPNATGVYTAFIKSTLFIDDYTA